MTVYSSVLSAMTAATEQIDQTAARLNSLLANQGSGLDSFDLSQQVVDLLSAKTAFEAAVQVAHVASETDRSLLDLLG